ncbi:glycosyltransferase family 4 protein [Halomonadaceae bacterium KBTZ08]
MKIGIDATALVANRTGIGNYIAPILAAMQRLNPTAQFLLYSNDVIAFPQDRRTIHRVANSKRRPPHWQNTQLPSMLRADQPDVFWGTNGLLPLVTPRSTATVVTIHDLVYRYAPQTQPWLTRWSRRLLQPWSARHADRLVTVSQATASDVERVYQRSPDAVVPPLPAIHALHSEAQGTGLDLPPRYLLSLGTLEPRKNIATLVQAYLDLCEKGVRLPVLVVAGKPGWRHDQTESLLARGERQGRIQRLGYAASAELRRLYAGCEAFLMPSLYEGYGMPLLEAQLCGAPVIHGPHDAMREAADGLGVICGTDYHALCATLEALAEGRLALTCRLPRTHQWTPETAAQRMLGELETACQGRRRTGATP